MQSFESKMKNRERRRDEEMGKKGTMTVQTGSGKYGEEDGNCFAGGKETVMRM